MDPLSNAGLSLGENGLEAVEQGNTAPQTAFPQPTLDEDLAQALKPSMPETSAFLNATGAPSPVLGELDNNAAFQSEVMDLSVDRIGEDLFRLPEDNPYTYADVRKYVEKTPGQQWGAMEIPRKDKEAYLHNFAAHGNVGLSKLQEPALDGLYNMARLAERDGYKLVVESGAGGKHTPTSYHYLGEAVDVNFKDRKGNYVSPALTVDLGKKYAQQTGWASMIDEYNHPSSYSSGPHLHMSWRNEGNGPGIHHFRKRNDPKERFKGDNESAAAAVRAGQAGAAQYIPRLAESIAAAEGIDPDVFTRLIRRESNYNPKARGSSGEIGLGQLMPGTLAEVAQQNGWDPEELKRDPTLQLKGSARYLRKLLDQNKGSYAQALAAYNAGPGNLEGYKQGRWDLTETTKDYVYEILAPVDPQTPDRQTAIQHMKTGGGRKWVPGKDSEFAKAHLQQAAELHSSWVSRLLGHETLGEFGQEFLRQVTSPDSPGSLLYQKSAFKPNAKNPGVTDYALGGLNLALDYAQDFLHGFGLHIVSKPTRQKEIAALGEGQGPLTKIAALGTGYAGQIAGGVAIGELALQKLIGTAAGGGLFAGVRGAATGTAAGGLLEGTAAGTALNSMWGIGATAFTDAFVSSMMDHSRGEFAPGKSWTDALGLSFANGVFASGLAISAGWMGSAALGLGGQLYRGLGLGAAETFAEIATATPLRQAGLGAMMGSAAGGMGAAALNMSGLSEAMFGQSIPITDSVMMGGVGGAIGAPLGTYISSKLMPQTELANTFREAAAARFKQGLEKNPEMAAQISESVLNMVSKKTDSEMLAAASLSKDHLDSYVGKLQQDVDLADKAMAFEKNKIDQTKTIGQALEAQIDAFKARYPGQISVLEQQTQAQKNAETRMAEITKQLQSGTLPNEKIAPLMTEQKNLQNEIKNAQRLQESVLGSNPNLHHYRDLQVKAAEISAKLQQAETKFAAKQQEYAPRRAGMEFMLREAASVRDGIANSLTEWGALGDKAGDFYGLVANKLKDQIAQPVQNATPWTSPRASEWVRNDPQGNKYARTLLDTWREALRSKVLESWQGRATLQDELTVKVNQIVKAYESPDAPAKGLSLEMGEYARDLQSNLTRLYNTDLGKALVTGMGTAEKHLMVTTGPLKFDTTELRITPGGKVARSRDAATAQRQKESLDFWRNVKLLDVGKVHDALVLGEAFGDLKPVSPDGLWKAMGKNGKIPLPEVRSDQDLPALFSAVKAAAEVGQSHVPFVGDSKVVQAALKNFEQQLQPAQANIRNILKNIGEHQDMFPNLPIAQMPGRDLSREYNPDYRANRIHKTQDLLSHTDKIGEAIQNPKDAAPLVGKINRLENEILARDIDNLVWTDNERRGWGKTNKGLGQHSRPAVLSSDTQNRQLGLTPNTVNTDPLLEQTLNLITAPGSTDFLTLDAAQSRLVKEALYGAVTAKRIGAAPGDIKGVAQQLWGSEYYGRNKGWEILIENIGTQMDSLVKSTFKKLDSKDNAPDFYRDLYRVIEDSKKFPEFENKYGKEGKTVLYYVNRVKSIGELVKAGSGELGDYMRAEWMAASFPKAMQRFFDTTGGKPGVTGLRTGFSAEELRRFGTMEEFQQKIQANIKRVRDLGYEPEDFEKLPLRQRMEALFDSQARSNMTADQLSQMDPVLYKRLVEKTEKISLSHLYDQPNEDVVGLLKSQLYAMVRAQSTRRFLNTGHAISVDIGGFKGTPRMERLVKILEPGEETPPMVHYPDGTKQGYKLVNTLPGFDNFATKLDGSAAIPSKRLAVHPDYYDFLAHTALAKPTWSNPDGFMGRAWKKMSSMVRTSALMGSWLPHARQTLTARFSEFLMTPGRALGAETMGTHLVNGPDREYRLAVLNAARSGVNLRMVQQSTRGLIQTLMDQMGPEVSGQLYGLEDSKVLRFLDAVNPNAPNQEISYNSLNKAGKMAADVLGAPLAFDHIVNREGLFKAIEAGMIGGFYHRRALYEEQYGARLAHLPPEARQVALDQMASTVVNHQAGALPYYMQSTLTRNLTGNFLTTPGWVMGKAHMILDAAESAFGWAQGKVRGKLLPQDQIELADAFKAMGVTRKYAGYDPEVRQILRDRMARTVAGGLFASIVAGEVMQRMIDGTSTFSHPPDKWFSLKIGDRYMSGFVTGHIRDFLTWVTGVAEGKPFEKAVEIIGRNMLPTAKALLQLVQNEDDLKRPIVGDYRGGFIESHAAKAKDIAGYMAKAFVNFEDTLGYRSNSDLFQVLSNQGTKFLEGTPNPQAISTKEYVLRSVGAYDSQDNWAIAHRADIQARQAFYRQKKEQEVRPFLVAAKSADPAQKAKLLQAAWALSQKALPYIDKELERYSVGQGGYRMTREQFLNMWNRIQEPDDYTVRRGRAGVVGGAMNDQLHQRAAQDAAAQQFSAPQDGAVQEAP